MLPFKFVAARTVCVLPFSGREECYHKIDFSHLPLGAERCVLPFKVLGLLIAFPAPAAGRVLNGVCYRLSPSNCLHSI